MSTVLITGVSRAAGIAAAVRDRLLVDGHGVITSGWTAYDTEHHIGIDAQTSTDIQADLSVADEPARLIDQAVQRSGPLSGLVIAHTYDSGGGVLDLTPELIDQHLAVNVRAALLLIQAFVEQLPEGTPGRVVIFASGPPQNGAIAYAASKGALEWITYSAATELGPRGLTVNAVNPGPNQTGWMTPEVEAEAARKTPVGRTGRPADAAALVSFLLSDDAAFINGQVLTSDGGHRIAAGSWPR